MARVCATSIPACGSVSFLRVAGEGWDGGQRADESFVPTSILPHTWGRKTLQYVSSIPACGSVSFLRVAGEGRDGGQRAEEVVCPPPQSSPIHGGGRCCPMPALHPHVAASPSPASRGKAGMGDSAHLPNLRAPSKPNVMLALYLPA